MLTKLPEEVFGPRIDFREYSFLDNPLLPKSVWSVLAGISYFSYSCMVILIFFADKEIKTKCSTVWSYIIELPNIKHHHATESTEVSKT